MENIISKEKLLKLWDTLNVLSNRHLPVKFSYFIIKNKKIIKEEIDILDQMIKPSTKYIEYDNKRRNLAFTLCDKDLKNNPIVENNNFVITQNRDLFNNEIRNIRSEYKEEVIEHEKKITEFNEVINELIQYTPYQISINNLPDELEPNILELFEDMNMIFDDN